MYSTKIVSVSVEQVKSSSDVPQWIIKAAKELRGNKDYPIELQHDCHYIGEKYIDHSNKIQPPNHPSYPSLERKYPFSFHFGIIAVPY